jgi:hypothetical protein
MILGAAFTLNTRSLGRTGWGWPVWRGGQRGSGDVIHVHGRGLGQRYGVDIVQNFLSFRAGKGQFLASLPCFLGCQDAEGWGV